MSLHHSQVKWSSFLHLLFILTLKLPSPTDSGKCEERCELYRPKGSQEPYRLYCSKVYDSQDDIDQCKNDCLSCPNICFSNNPEVYECPFFKMKRRCLDFCEANRYGEKQRTSGAYVIRCWSHYKTDEEYCKSFCKDCNEKVCHPKNPSEYNCPADYGSSVEEPEPFTEDSDDDSDGGPLSTLAIVGIVLGVLLFVMIVGVVIFFFIRRKGKVQDQTQLGGTPTGGMVYLAKGQVAQQQLSPMTLEPSSSTLSMAESPSSSEVGISQLKHDSKSKKSKK